MSILLQPIVPDTLIDRLRNFSNTIAESRRRFRSERSVKADRVEHLIQSQAWTDAALALIDLELPHWQIRSLTYDGGEWFCALSRQRNMPDWLDQPVETHHADLARAILDAFAEAKRISAPQNRDGDPVQATVAPLYEPVCSENFA